MRLALISIRTHERNKESNTVPCRSLQMERVSHLSFSFWKKPFWKKGPGHACRETKGRTPIIDPMYIIENCNDVSAPGSSVYAVTIVRVGRVENVGSISCVGIDSSLRIESRAAAWLPLLRVRWEPRAYSSEMQRAARDPHTSVTSRICAKN
jgi:hypothetical protein